MTIYSAFHKVRTLSISRHPPNLQENYNMKSLCPTSNFLALIRSPAPTSNDGDEDFDAHLDRNHSFYASSSVYFAPLLAGQSK